VNRFFMIVLLIALAVSGCTNQSAQLQDVDQSFSTSNYGSDELVNPNTVGNTIGNYANGGIAAAQGNWIYFISNAGTKKIIGKIYKMRPDGTEITQVTTDDAFFIGVIGDWIYYRNEDDLAKIYKIRTNGTERTRLTDDYTGSLFVSGDWMYYSNIDDDSRIYKVRTDGTGREKISDDSAMGVIVDNDKIYYSNQNDHS